MNIVYVNYTVRDNVFDYAWLSFKSYVEDNYKGSAKWNWHYPINDSRASDTNELVDRILRLDPKVVMFSVYVWNVGLSREIARLVKEARPDVYVVFGGPYSEYKEDPEYFEKHPYVDFTCQTDGYGEPFVNEFLYQIETDKDWNKVPFMVRKEGYSPALFNKRGFQWPKRIFERNSDYLHKVNAERIGNTTLMTVYETQRGCPYGCTFCEWSGGINAKVAFRPTEDVVEDFTWLAQSGLFEDLHMVEANLGQLDRDVDLIRELCEIKKKYGAPRDVVLAGLSKSRKANVYKIDRLLAESGLSNGFKISMQDMDPEVLKNIERVDEPWEKQFKVYNELRDEFRINLRAEMIRGLPGTTLESFYKQAGEMAKHDVFWDKYTWHLLPTSPASNPAYMEKFKIEAIDLITDSMKGSAFNAKMIDEDQFTQIGGLVNDPRFIQPSKVVVATMSYTRDEYAEMVVSDGIIFAMETEGYLSRITTYLDSIGIPHAVFYKRLYDTFIDPQYLNSIQFTVLKAIILQATEKVQEKSASPFEYYKLEGLPWNIYAKIPTLVNIAINLNREEFYTAIHKWIIDQFGDDDKLEDLIKWSLNMVKWIDYDPTEPRSFSSRFDWTSDELVEGTYVNTPLDTLYSREDLPIEWHTLSMEDRVKQYFIRLCALHGSNKMFEHVKVDHVA
jgi:putative methyltransferase